MSIESVMLSISSSATLYSSCPQSFPASKSFTMSRLFTSGGHNTVASASASVLPVNIQGWCPLGLTSLISLLSKGLSRFLQHHSLKASVLWSSVFFVVQLSHLYMTTGKTIIVNNYTTIALTGKGKLFSSPSIGKENIFFFPLLILGSLAGALQIRMTKKKKNRSTREFLGGRVVKDFTLSLPETWLGN